MINSIKKLAVNFIQSRIKYRKSSKKKVLIQLNEYFSKSSWLEAFNNIYKDHRKVLDLFFSTNKYNYIKHCINSDIIFSFNFNSIYLKNNKSLELFYLGQRGKESIADIDWVNNDFRIVRVPPYGANYIEEYIIFAIYALKRNFHISLQNKSSKKWSQKELMTISNRSLNDMVIGIAGVGKIGSKIAESLTNFGFTVYGWDSDISKDIKSLHSFFNKNKLSQFLKQIDICILTLPLNSDTQNLFNYKKLSLFKKGSYLINVSRGDIIVEDDLLKVIKEGIIKGAALDVFSNEPLPKSNTLWNEKNIIITPHIAGNINLFVDKIQKDFILKIKDLELNA